LLNNQEVLLTERNQKYNYLYIEDLLTSFKKFIYNVNDLSGIFNLCSGKSMQIKKLLIIPAELIDVPTSLLKLGAIPYHENQNMDISGN
jgi:hypothetical protein